MQGSFWFKRLVRECKKISPHIRIVPIKMGFYRIYWKEAYMHECYSEMPYKGYDIEEEDPRLMDKHYYEEYEDNVQLTRKIKNFVEGYVDSIAKIKKRVWLFKNDQEHYKQAKRAYRTMKVK